MATVLQFGMRKDPAVEDLQQRLNCRAPTRLPRFQVDGNYGVMTTARVMEFQFQRGLTFDGAAGPNTLRLLSGGPTDCANPTTLSGRCILVDLINRRLTAFNNGNADLRISPIMGGRPAAPSTWGVFQMTSRRLRHHTSSDFPDPPDNMQFSLFYHDKEAIHMGNPNAPSHGCIHVGPPNAERVFNWAGSQDVLVIVVKLRA